MEEDFTKEDLEYINEPFTKADLKYIQEMKSSKYGYYSIYTIK